MNRDAFCCDLQDRGEVVQVVVLISLCGGFGLCFAGGFLWACRRVF